MEWRPIETAPKGGGAEFVDDPNYVKPPKLLLLFGDDVAVGYWEWYFAEGGAGHKLGNSNAWAEAVTDEPLSNYFDAPPTHWMPLPPPPTP